MKDKFTLTGTDNDGFRHRYSVKKNENFKKAFVDFMVDLGFDSEIFKREWVVYETTEDDVDVPRELKISEIVDVCWHYQNKKFDVDVFYGKSKMIIVVRTKGRIPMVRYLENKADWIEPLSYEEIEEEKNKGRVKSPLRKNKNF